MWYLPQLSYTYQGPPPRSFMIGADSRTSHMLIMDRAVPRLLCKQDDRRTNMSLVDIEPGVAMPPDL